MSKRSWTMTMSDGLFDSGGDDGGDLVDSFVGGWGTSDRENPKEGRTILVILLIITATVPQNLGKPRYRIRGCADARFP